MDYGHAASRCDRKRHECAPQAARTRAAARAAAMRASTSAAAVAVAGGGGGGGARCEMFDQFQTWAMMTYGDSGKTKTVTRKKYTRIVNMLRADDAISNGVENSKFRFWVKAKGFKVDGKQALMVPCSQIKSLDGSEETVYKKVAVVENFFDIIYNVHVEMESRGGKHAGQKRTYKAISERYAFLPREAVTRFLMQCMDCQKRMHLQCQTSPETGMLSAADCDSNGSRSNSCSQGSHQEDQTMKESIKVLGQNANTCSAHESPEPATAMDFSVPITTSFLKRHLSTPPKDSTSYGGSESSGGVSTPTADEEMSPYNVKGGTCTEEEEELMEQGLDSPSGEEGPGLYPIVASMAHQNADHAYDRPLDMSKSESHCHVTRAHTRSSAAMAAAAAAAAASVHTSTAPATLTGSASGVANSSSSKMVAIAWTLPPPPAVNGDLRDHHSVNSSMDMKGLIDHTYDEAGNQRKMGASCDALFRWRPQVVCNGRASRETSGTPEDLSGGTKDEDEDDEDENDDRIDPHKYDPERLKAFNMFVRLFVDENLDRMVPISKQPKEKIQAIIDSCSRQFPEFSERARKRIRTYLKSCRRTKRSRDQNGWDLCRPAPPHLTSAMAEQILAAACENETNNAKRMRIGLDPVNTNSAHHVEKEHVDQGATPPRQPNTYARNGSSSANGHAVYRSTTPVSTNGPLSQHQTTSNNAISNGPTDLSMKKPSAVMKCSLNPSEVAAVRQLIAGYRESAAFLIRSADELEQLLLQQN